MAKISHYIEYVFVLILRFLIRCLPYKFALFLGGILGKVAYFIDKKHRNIALTNLDKAFKGEKTKEELIKINKALFNHLCKCFIEFIMLPRFKGRIKDIVKIEGLEHLHSAFKKGKGAIMLVPHFGNWEIAGVVYSMLLPSRSNAIAFPQSNKLTDRLINEQMEFMGIKIIYTGNAIKTALQCLRRNEAVGFLADQDARGDGVFINFFGRPASTNKGPVVFALKTGAPILMTFMIRQKDDTHLFVIEPEVIMEKTGDYNKDILVNTQKWNDILEKYVRKYPEQWFWVHRRWKTQP